MQYMTYIHNSFFFHIYHAIKSNVHTTEPFVLLHYLQLTPYMWLRSDIPCWQITLLEKNGINFKERHQAKVSIRPSTILSISIISTKFHQNGKIDKQKWPQT